MSKIKQTKANKHMEPLLFTASNVRHLAEYLKRREAFWKTNNVFNMEKTI